MQGPDGCFHTLVMPLVLLAVVLLLLLLLLVLVVALLALLLVVLAMVVVMREKQSGSTRVTELEVEREREWGKGRGRGRGSHGTSPSPVPPWVSSGSSLNLVMLQYPTPNRAVHHTSFPWCRGECWEEEVAPYQGWLHRMGLAVCLRWVYRRG